MLKTPTSQEDEFYEELDKKTEKKSSCSLLTLGIFFGVLFLITAAVLLLLFRSLRPSKPNLDNFSLGDVLQIDYSKKEPQIEVSITEEELTSILQAGVQGGGAKITKAQATINPSEISINGDLDILFTTKVSLKVMPVVKDDQLYLKIIQIKTWKFGLPGIIRSSLERSLNELMDEKLSDFYQNYKVTDLQSENDRLLIYGKLK